MVPSPRYWISMAPPRRAARRRRSVTVGWTAVLALALLVTVGAFRGCGARRSASVRTIDAGHAAAVEPFGRPGGSAAGPALPPEPPSSAGWEEAAEAIVADLRGLLAGRPGPGSFAEALAEASRRDLARYPPSHGALRRGLLGSDEDRARALAALAAAPVPDEELVGLALRIHRSDDDPVVRLLDAEVAASTPPQLLSRHEEELLQAFAGEENPLVLAVALPALEQLDERGFTELLRTQVAIASPPMLPILVGLARDRLGSASLAAAGVVVGATSGAGDR